MVEERPERERLRPWPVDPTAFLWCDRSLWPPGPWDGEPDFREFRHMGLPCIVCRGAMGGWCGYLGVPPGHVWHGKHQEEIDRSAAAEFPYELSYASPCSLLICHTPAPGEPEDVWWMGFDLQRAGDYTPDVAMMMQRVPGLTELMRDWVYPNERFAQEAVRVLAELARKEMP